MKKIETKYGTLKGISTSFNFSTGELKECMLDEYNEIKTLHGTFIPQYTQEHVRKRFSKSLSFYKNGTVKSINLQEKQKVATSYGILPAELISFYEDESIKRIFPLNGKITGYWTEDDEYTLAESFEFELPFATIDTKFIGLQLYPQGSLKSMTLWPNEKLSIDTPLGPVEVRVGFSLYEDGQLKSCEPKKFTGIFTPIGMIYAFDVTALGIHGDTNSLIFSQDGQLASLITSTDSIEIISSDNESILIKPELVPSLMDPEVMATVPVKIEFIDGCVKFNDCPNLQYDLDTYTFKINNMVHNCYNKCAGCTSSDKCS